METELLKVFDSDRIQIDVASREEVHRLGHWPAGSSVEKRAWNTSIFSIVVR